MNIESFIISLGEKFMEFYREFIYKNEYDPLLTNGYCLYFASLLKKLMPTGKVFGIEGNHYFFYIEGKYFDGYGKIKKEGDVLFLPTGLATINQINEITDIENEIIYGEILDADFHKKEIIWKRLEPLLLEYGKNILMESKQEEIQRKRP